MQGVWIYTTSLFLCTWFRRISDVTQLLSPKLAWHQLVNENGKSKFKTECWLFLYNKTNQSYRMTSNKSCRRIISRQAVQTHHPRNREEWKTQRWTSLKLLCPRFALDRVLEVWPGHLTHESNPPHQTPGASPLCFCIKIAVYLKTPMLAGTWRVSATTVDTTNETRYFHVVTLAWLC